MTASEITNSDEVMVISPRNKLKFLCSYGGKIMARPGEQNLKYIGGETRVVAVPRDITFSEIMKKLNSLVEGGGDMILKYQVIPEELDALVTVRSDEDLKHMVEEYNRLESEGTPKLRAFLFPASPVIIENPVDPHAFDQRYLEAVNGVIRPTSSSYSGRLSPLNATFSVSTSSSPKSSSPDGRNHIDSSPLEPGILNAYHPSRRGIPKVQSSPSLYSLGTHQTQSNHQFYQPHHYYQQQLHPYSAHSPRLPQDFRMERLPGPYDFGWGAMGHGHGHGHGHCPTNHVYSVGLGRHNWGNGGGRFGCYDEGWAYRSAQFCRGGSVPASGRLETPDCPSPRNNIWE